MLHTSMLQAHIERALHDHFLFRKLTDTQCHVLLDCMQRVEVQPGDVVVKQASFLALNFFSNLFRVPQALVHNLDLVYKTLAVEMDQRFPTIQSAYGFKWQYECNIINYTLGYVNA